MHNARQVRDRSGFGNFETNGAFGKLSLGQFLNDKIEEPILAE